MVGALLRLATGVQLARMLGPRQLGFYSLALSISALVSVPTEFGLTALVTRETATACEHQNWGQLRGVLSWANRVIAVTAPATMVTAVVVVFAWRGIRPEFVATLYWALVLVPAVPIMNTRAAALLASGRPVLSQIPALILRPGLFALALLATSLVAHGSLLGSAAMRLQALVTVVAMTVALALLVFYLPPPVRTVQPQYRSAAWFRATLPMGLTEGLRVVQGHLAVFLVGLFSTPQAVGLFKVADSASQLCLLPISIVFVVMAPSIARFHSASNSASLQRLLAYSTAAVLAGILTLSLPLAIGGPRFLAWVFGHQFGAAYPTLMVLCFGYATAVAMGPATTYMNMTGGEQQVTRALVLGVLANALVAVVAIPRLGSIGAAMGNTTGYFVWVAILWRAAHKRDNIDTSLIASLRVVPRDLARLLAGARD